MIPKSRKVLAEIKGLKLNMSSLMMICMFVQPCTQARITQTIIQRTNGKSMDSAHLAYF